MADRLLKEDGGALLTEDGGTILLRSQVGKSPTFPPMRRPPKIQFRRGTTAEWASANPVLASGEPGLDTTTRDLKIGDGGTAWASLPISYAPASIANYPRGIVAISDSLNPAPTINAAGVDLTSSLFYTFDPTRRYRANYTIRAQTAASSVQFQLVNAINGAVVASDHIPGSPTAVGPGYSGEYFNWLFTASGLMDLRARTTGFFTAGMIIYGTGAGGFYLEDVGAA